MMFSEAGFTPCIRGFADVGVEVYSCLSVEWSLAECPSGRPYLVRKFGE